MPEDALDQPEWQALTTWRGEAPSFGATWELLIDERLPRAFRLLVHTMSHPFLRDLQREAIAVIPLDKEPVLERRTWNNRFANLVSGRFTEKLFYQTYAAELQRLGLSFEETTAEHDWLDYLIREPAYDFTLGINVKNAGVQFWSAADRVGLDPEDTLPIATYKIFGSTARENHVPLVYVYLVDWSLLSRLRVAYWSALNEAEQTVFRLMTSFRRFPRKLEDCFIECTVADRLATLHTAVGYKENKLSELPFRAISGRKCQRIFYTNHDRAPYVYVQRMNTDPNVHISVANETVHFADFIDRWLTDPANREALILGLGKVELFPVPDPPM